MKNLFPDIYITSINTYFSCFSAFAQKKLLKIKRHKPRMGIGTDINVILSFTTIIYGPFKIVH